LSQAYSKRALDLLNINIIDRSIVPIPSGPCLIVSNHLSYVDILVMSAMTECIFVTSTDTKNSGWEGKLCKLNNCLFVDRKDKSFREQEVASVAAALKSGKKVVVYPEGTSTDGSQVLKFKALLFQAAIDANVPVVATSIRYDSPDVAYYGKMKINSHLLKLTTIPKIQAFFGAISIVNIADLDRYSLASFTENQIREHLSYQFLTQNQSAPDSKNFHFVDNVYK